MSRRTLGYAEKSEGQPPYGPSRRTLPFHMLSAALAASLAVIPRCTRMSNSISPQAAIEDTVKG